MLTTIKHQSTGKLVVVAKLLTDYLKVKAKIGGIDSYVKVNGTYDADFTAYMVTWQTHHGLTSDGICGPKTWTVMAQNTPTCSTSKNRTSGYTLALQLLLGGNITPDGIYGSRTKSAVAVFQDSHGLKVDGICGPKTWSTIIVGASETPVTPPTPGKFVQPVDYKQGDSRWGKKMYSNHNDKSQTMANSGCGPTACADVVATLKDKSVTPWTLAQLSMEWGDRTRNSGTSWDFFKHVAKHYSFTKFVQSSSLDALKACLDAGGYVVCSMGPGYWTSGGHFICAWKYDDNYIYCNDPASSTRKKQKIADFMKQRKQFFCFYPDARVEDNAGDTVSTSPIKSDGVKRGEKICDISKYQPNVNYDAFIADTALIILRAGYSGTAGGIHEDQKFKAHADALIQRGVRFGVYFFSIATTEEKAREEARMFYHYAKGYSPLFWAMDAENQSITKAAIVAFGDELYKLGAGKVGCYVANHLYQKYDYSTVRDKFDFTWIPRYGSTKPVYPCDMWQFTSTGSVNGIGGNVDLSCITGEGHPLSWFTDDIEYGTKQDAVIPQKVVITGDLVNVRSGPGTNNSVIGTARKGETFDFGLVTDNWYQIDFKGAVGWVSAKYAGVM